MLVQRLHNRTKTSIATQILQAEQLTRGQPKKPIAGRNYDLKAIMQNSMACKYILLFAVRKRDSCQIQKGQI